MLEKDSGNCDLGEVPSASHDCSLPARAPVGPGAGREECGEEEQSSLYTTHICINHLFLISAGGIHA